MPETPDAAVAEQAAGLADQTPGNVAADQVAENATPGSADDGSQSKRELLSTIKERFSLDLSTKYADDDALLAGLVNAQALASRRDVDADRGRQIEQLVQGREEEFKAFLLGQSQPVQAADPNTPFDPARARSQMQVGENGEWVPAPGAPAGIVPQYKQHQEQLRDFIEKFHSDPKAIIQEAMAGEIEELVRTYAGQQTVQQREVMALEKWEGEQAALLYVGGDSKAGLTPLGRQVVDLYQSELLQATAKGLPRARVAMQLAQTQQPQAKLSPSSPQGKRQPDTANALPDDTPGIRKGESLSQTLRRIAENTASAVA